ncbi:MAG: YigZ family protein [Mariprofundaceae bacterium]|nr:YigZ family protein [Mariprofundaceae bacterium]
MSKPIVSYMYPAQICCVEQEIKRSRFIATAARASDKKEALAVIAAVRQQYPDARHHCWAYVAGSPETVALGMSDDGEPQGTAGKPMLNVLKHKKIGEIVVVISRYFGGIKLGAGGLVRAYASSVQLVINALPLQQYIPMQKLKLSFPYAFESTARHLFLPFKVNVLDVSYSHQVEMCIELQIGDVNTLSQHLIDQSKGRIQITELDDRYPRQNNRIG